MADDNAVIAPYIYFPDPIRGRPIANGYVYVGRPDTDPEVPANQIKVRAVQETGLTVPIAQPIRTGAGGVPMLNGSPVQLIADGEYSIKVLDSMRAQIYYAPSLVGGLRPTTIVRTQPIPLSFELPNRFINKNLFDPNATAKEYFDLSGAAVDLGPIGSAPFDFENIPASRFDLADESTAIIDLGDLS